LAQQQSASNGRARLPLGGNRFAAATIASGPAEIGFKKGKSDVAA
jgi:hypothetical protein